MPRRGKHMDPRSLDVDLYTPGDLIKAKSLVKEFEYYSMMADRLWAASEKLMRQSRARKRRIWVAGTCYCCGARGHHYKSCWLNIVNTGVCFGCGERGHIFRDCRTRITPKEEPLELTDDDCDAAVKLKLLELEQQLREQRERQQAPQVQMKGHIRRGGRRGRPQKTHVVEMTCGAVESLRMDSGDSNAMSSVTEVGFATEGSSAHECAVSSSDAPAVSEMHEDAQKSRPSSSGGDTTSQATHNWADTRLLDPESPFDEAASEPSTSLPAHSPTSSPSSIFAHVAAAHSAEEGNTGADMGSTESVVQAQPCDPSDDGVDSATQSDSFEYISSVDGC